MNIKEEGVDCGVKAEKAKVFESGAIRSDSTGKGRFDLISPFGLKRLALRYEGGAIHKGDRNFEKGFPISRCIEAAIRHINEYNEGDREEDHLAAAAWQLFIIMHFEEMIKRGRLPKSLDNQPRYKTLKREEAKSSNSDSKDFGMWHCKKHNTHGHYRDRCWQCKNEYERDRDIYDGLGEVEPPKDSQG